MAVLAALMKTIEEAMAEGRGELRLPCDGMRITCRNTPDALRSLTLVWRSNDGDEPETNPLPQTKVLELT